MCIRDRYSRCCLLVDHFCQVSSDRPFPSRINTPDVSSRVAITPRTLPGCFGPLRTHLGTPTVSKLWLLHEIQRKPMKSIDFPMLGLHRDSNVKLTDIFRFFYFSVLGSTLVIYFAVRLSGHRPSFSSYRKHYKKLFGTDFSENFSFSIFLVGLKPENR